MRIIYCLLVVCLIGVSKVSAYHCYECNSTYDKNCFDFSPKFSYYKAVNCDVVGAKGQENCFSVKISDKKNRKMYRGCGKIGECDRYEAKEQNIHYKVLACQECNSHNCNNSTTLIPPFILVTLFTLYHKLFN